MFNPYSIILGLFTVAGLVTTLWGLSIIIKARRTAAWPCVTGVIESSGIAAETDDLLPDIRFSYTVADKEYLKTVEFPSGTTPTQEFSQDYVARFSQGTPVTVHYNPVNPDQATLEPGQRPGDWMILAFGLGTTAFMLIAWLMAG
jgi:hypothetical protein